MENSRPTFAHPAGSRRLQGHQLKSPTGAVQPEQKGNRVSCSCDRVGGCEFHLH